MNANDLLDYIGNVDDTFIAEAKLLDHSTFSCTNKMFPFMFKNRIFCAGKRLALAVLCMLLMIGMGVAVYAVVPQLFTDSIERHRAENDILDALYQFDKGNIDKVDLIIHESDGETTVNVVILCKEYEISEDIQNDMKELIANSLNIESTNIYLICILSEDW